MAGPPRVLALGAILAGMDLVQSRSSADNEKVAAIFNIPGGCRRGGGRCGDPAMDDGYGHSPSAAAAGRRGDRTLGRTNHVQDDAMPRAGLGSEVVSLRGDAGWVWRWPSEMVSSGGRTLPAKARPENPEAAVPLPASQVVLSDEIYDAVIGEAALD